MMIRWMPLSATSAGERRAVRNDVLERRPADEVQVPLVGKPRGQAMVDADLPEQHAALDG